MFLRLLKLTKALRSIYSRKKNGKLLITAVNFVIFYLALVLSPILKLSSSLDKNRTAQVPGTGGNRKEHQLFHSLIPQELLSDLSGGYLGVSTQKDCLYITSSQLAKTIRFSQGVCPKTFTGNYFKLCICLAYPWDNAENNQKALKNYYVFLEIQKPSICIGL